MRLSIQQQAFAMDIGLLLVWIYTRHPGWSVTFGDSYRPPEMVAIYVKRGIGSRSSLHPKRLAMDLNLFINGVYQKGSLPYAPLGIYWESLDPMNRWGGRFKRKDGNHFERVQVKPKPKRGHHGT